MAVMVAAGISLSAQKTTQVHPGKGGSPHVKSEWTIDGANISIEYGRPSVKGRSDGELMPEGRPWRTGADEATVLTTDKALTLTVDLSAAEATLLTRVYAVQLELI